MVEPGHALRFALEGALAVRVPGLEEQHLDRDGQVETSMERPVDPTEATTTELLLNLEILALDPSALKGIWQHGGIFAWSS